MKSLCVFCGSGTGSSPVYLDAARILASALNERNLTLVFGGGHIGLMGVLADTVLAKGGRAVGVIPQALVDRELAHRGCELRIVQSMHALKLCLGAYCEQTLFAIQKRRIDRIPTYQIDTRPATTRLSLSGSCLSALCSPLF